MDKATPSPASADSVMAKAMMLVGALDDSCEEATSLPFLEAVTALRAEVERLAAQSAPTEEMSPEFTDTARAALLWVLWHHQGASSKVGQPIRFALGMDQYQPLSEYQVREAKRWVALNPTRDAANVPPGEWQNEGEGLTPKQAWWAGYRVGKGLPPDMPRSEAVAQSAPLAQQAAREYPPLPKLPTMTVLSELQSGTQEMVRLDVAHEAMRAYVDADRASAHVEPPAGRVIPADGEVRS